MSETISKLPVDYQIISSMIFKKDKLVIEMEDALLEDELYTQVINPKTGEVIEFGYLYEWKIDIRLHADVIYDSDEIERIERIWIAIKDLAKLEGYVLRFIHEGVFVDQDFCYEATYIVRGGELVPAPEYLSTTVSC